MRFIMQTCPPREAVFRDTLAHAPASTEVVTDTGGGNLQTFLRVLALAGSGAFVFLEDDLVFTSNFEKKACFVAATWPFFVVSMFSFNKYMQKDPRCPPSGRGSPARRSGKHLQSNLCVYYPPGIADAILTFYSDTKATWASPDRQHGDLLVREALEHIGLMVLHYVPNLVQHKDGPSVSMKGTHRPRVSETFEA